MKNNQLVPLSSKNQFSQKEQINHKIRQKKKIMSSQPASQPDSIDLAYDMWAGQFEFVGPTNQQTNKNNNSHTNNNNLNNKCRIGGQQNRKLSTDSLEDLNLSFNTSSTQNPLSNAYSLGVTGGGEYCGFGKHHPPILIDQETFLSLNPADFEDIVPSNSEPNSLVFIDNKLETNNNSFVESNNNNINNNNNKIYNLENLTSKFNNKTNNTNTNGFKLENLKNFKNKLLCDFEDTNGTGNGTGGGGPVSGGSGPGGIMNGALSAEMCDNLNEQVSNECI